MPRNARVPFLCIWGISLVAIAAAAEPPPKIPVTVPAGFRVSLAASSPLVERPVFAAVDSTGVLYVLDSGGVNGNDRRENPPDVVRRLTDTDGDGIYDQSSVFADKIVFGAGLACYDNAVFVTSPPSLWRFEDTTGDGVADKRTELVTGFAFNQSCTDDLHGACLGPDGRIYFLPGRFHHQAKTMDGTTIREGVGPWVMRCRPDGRDAEIVGGAVGNPVEVAFLPTGDAFSQGTFWAKPSAEGGLRDAVIHAVLGGEYSVRDRDYTDRVRTGDFLPALVPLTATAPSGLMAYQSDAWGPEYRHNLFTSHFNTGRILRHRLSPQGGTFTSQTEDFVTAAQGDVHFTDVLEDADGSLLVVDTGGWYRACCPASGSSKPEVKGGVYRVSRAGLQRDKDPYGNSLRWEDAKIAELNLRLDDSRFAVRERAIAALSKRGDEAIAELAQTLRSRTASSGQRLNAVWALCRMDGDNARAAIRVALDDPAPDVRQSAAHAVALHRDEAAQGRLVELLRDSSLFVRRGAADALGRVGRGSAVPHLLKAIADLEQDSVAANDRFVEHALIFALISINDAAATRQGLRASGFAERRAALLALDQMPLTLLGSEDIAPLLSTNDPRLLQAAIEVLARHPEWTAESVRLVEGWLNEKELDDGRVNILVGVVRALRADKSMQQLLDKSLAHQDKLSTPARRALLRAVARCEARNVSSAWRRGLAESLESSEPVIRLAALQAVESLFIKELADRIHRNASDHSSSAMLRLAALRTLTVLRQDLTDQEFEYVLARVSPDSPIQERLTAFDVLAQARHSDDRLRRLLPLVQSANPIELPRLLSAFARGGSEEIGRRLVETLAASSVSPAPELVEQTLQPYGDKVLAAAGPLFEQLKKSVRNQVARLNELEAMLERHSGDAKRGRDLFFGKAQCHLCHTIAERGGKVGPDLTAIGDIRSQRDLLEAIAFPSATFARGFEPIIVTLEDGRVLSGLAGRETPAELVLMVIRDNKPEELPLRRELIEQVQMGRVSTMPNGLDLQLQPQELSDLVGFLRQLRRPRLGTQPGQ